MSPHTDDKTLLFLSSQHAEYFFHHNNVQLNHAVVGGYGLEFEIRDTNLLKLEELFDYFLEKLTNVLNQVHGSRLNKREWEILLGHWLRRFLAIAINALGKLELTFQTFDVSSVVSDEYSTASLAPFDTGDFTRMLSDPDWLLGFYSKFYYLFQTSNALNVTNYSHVKSAFSVGPLMIPPAQSGKLQPRKLLSRLQEYVSPYSQNVITSTYLPRGVEWGIALQSQSIPQGLRFQKKINASEIDPNFRSTLRDLLAEGGSTKFEINQISELLTDFLPVVFVEGYKNAIKSAEEMRGRRTPRYIFTSNDFDSNEIFKFWLVSKIRKGSKYIVGQHGNNYGTSKYFRNTIEERTADKFVSWGLNRPDTNYVSGFIFKNPKGKEIKSNPTGRFLLTQLHYPIPATTWDSDFEYLEYLQNLKSLVGELDLSVFQNLTLKLHPAATRVGWSDVDYWKNANPLLQILSSSEKISELYPTYRLVIHGYDSTGILETLSLNYPTLGYMPNGLSELLVEAQPNYSRLIEAGILHTSPESLAQQLNFIASDVESWWRSSKIQNSRKDFIETYARSTSRPLNIFRKSVFI